MKNTLIFHRQGQLTRIFVNKHAIIHWEVYDNGSVLYFHDGATILVQEQPNIIYEMVEGEAVNEDVVNRAHARQGGGDYGAVPIGDFRGGLPAGGIGYYDAAPAGLPGANGGGGGPVFEIIPEATVPVRRDRPLR